MTESTQYTPVALRGDRAALTIEWNDGAVHRLAWPMLRAQCPCVTCRAERGAPPPPPQLLPVLAEAPRAEAIYAQSMRPLGNYAYHIAFSDGHGTGIFSLELLRALGEAPNTPPGH